MLQTKNCFDVCQKLSKVNIFIFYSHEILAALPAHNTHIYYPYRNTIQLNEITVMILLQMKIRTNGKKFFICAFGCSSMLRNTIKIPFSIHFEAWCINSENFVFVVLLQFVVVVCSLYFWCLLIFPFEFRFMLRCKQMYGSNLDIVWLICTTIRLPILYAFDTCAKKTMWALPK